jgi:hypothetical protein
MPIAAIQGIDVSPVRTRRQWKSFHSLPAEIQSGAENWVQPLSLQSRQMWAPRHPFFRHAKAAAWLATRAGKPIGRISGQVDALQAECGRPTMGQFGQLEAIDDPAVFQALTDVAGEWLVDQGMTEVTGPFDLSINQQCGLLVDGHDQAPMMMMNYNPPWYPDHLESAGFETAVETLAYRGSPRYELPARVARLLTRANRRLEIRPVARSEIGGLAEPMRRIFNAAWAANWGFVPLTEAEFRHMIDEMKLLLRPGYVQVAAIDGELAGFIVALPDLNELVADLHGRLFPFGAPRLLWRIARKRNRRARIPLMGILPAHQRSFMGAAISYALIEAVAKALIDDGVEVTEQSWILADNQGMRSIVEAIGMQVAQRFRIYRKTLAA